MNRPDRLFGNNSIRCEQPYKQRACNPREYKHAACIGKAPQKNSSLGAHHALCLPRTDADNVARLLDLQTWAAAESAAGRGPVLGNAGREVLRAEQGRMERADAGGTAVYTVRLQAEYTQVYTEETT